MTTLQRSKAIFQDSLHFRARRRADRCTKILSSLLAGVFCRAAIKRMERQTARLTRKITRLEEPALITYVCPPPRFPLKFVPLSGSFDAIGDDS
jgi:hypothetical protein